MGCSDEPDYCYSAQNGNVDHLCGQSGAIPVSAKSRYYFGFVLTWILTVWIQAISLSSPLHLGH